MSFDIFLIDATRSKSIAEAQQLVREVVARHNGKLIKKPGDETSRREYIHLPDGSRIEWYGPSETGEDAGAEMTPRGGTTLKSLCSLLYDLAASVHWVIAPTMEGGVFLRAVESKNVSVYYEDFPETTVITGAGDLEAILSSGLADWREYRDHVLSQP